MITLTKKQKQALLDGIWSGEFSPTELPYWLYNEIAKDLEFAAVEGWGNALGAGKTLKDIALEKSIQENLYYFAAHKTQKELVTMNEVFRATDNKYTFVKEALKVEKLYNQAWLNTEYNVTLRIARAGRDWQRIEATKEYFPKLMFLAVNDANTRDEHAALHGTVRPVDDDFWLTYFPPLDWNCRCRTERVEDGNDTDLSSKNLPDIEPQFSERVTESKKIWSETHPYFQDVSKAEQKAVDRLVEQKLNEDE